MRIIMLGTGAALPDPDRNHSSILVTIRDRHYLLDCGHGATHQMMRAGVDPTQVNHVFLSHLHFDHICEFPFFMISTWICNREKAPIVVGPPGTQRFVDQLLANGAFSKDIEARSQYKNRQNLGILQPDVRECEPGLIFEDDLVQVRACLVDHIPDDITQCFGLRLDSVDGKSVVFSGDTAPCERLVELAKGADLLVHECTFPEKAIEFRKKIQIGTYAHTSPTELGKLATRANVKSLVATHFGHFDTTNPILKQFLSLHMPAELIGPAFMEDVVRDIRQHWSGELRIARDLMRIDL